MIKINLLPEELRREEFSISNVGFDMQGKGPLVRNIAVAVILALVVTHGAFFFVKTTASNELAALSKKYNSLLPQKKEYEALKAEVELSNKKGKAIDDLMANRFLWAKKLNELSDSIIPGIWLIELSYEESQGEIVVEVPVSPMPVGMPGRAKRETTRQETRKTTIRHLTLSGYASSMGEQGTSLIGKFIKSMKDNSEIASAFSDIKLESIKSDKVADQEVMNFKITCTFK